MPFTKPPSPKLIPLDYQNEKPYLLIPVGYPAQDAKVPDIRKKPLDEVMVVVSAAKAAVHAA